MSFLLFLAFVAWEDVRRSFWLHSLIAFALWGACRQGELSEMRHALLGLHLLARHLLLALHVLSN